MSEERKLKVILSGGGTGGHIYPAVAVAEALGRRLGDRVDVLFVGAEGKMEMEKVPALGYPIVGLPVAGLQRRLTLRNLTVPASSCGRCCAPGESSKNSVPAERSASAGMPALRCCGARSGWAFRR